MTRLARWCFTRRRTVLAAWLLLLVVALGAARAAGGAFNSSLSLPGTDSQAAVSLLTEHYPAAAGETDQVVIQATGGATIESAPVRDAVTAALARVSALPGIASVASPYTAAGATQVSRGGTVAFARVTWDKQPDQITAADAGALIAAAQSADGPGVHVSLGGASITNSERAKPGPSVAVGVIAALVILLLVFGGAVLSALTPLAGGRAGAGHRLLGDHAAQPRAERRERLHRPRRAHRPRRRRRLRALHRQQAPGGGAGRAAPTKTPPPRR